jgi:hypothetical protein
VVRDEVRRVVRELGELPDASVAPSERREQGPALRVGDQLEELER